MKDRVNIKVQNYGRGELGKEVVVAFVVVLLLNCFSVFGRGELGKEVVLALDDVTPV